MEEPSVSGISLSGGADFARDESGDSLDFSSDAPPPSGEAASRGDLLATIHEQIIPKLVIAHGAIAPQCETCPEFRLPPTAAEIFEFARIVVWEDLTTALAFIGNLASQGVSRETVLLHLVAPAARLLGEQWEDDITTFSDVTIGMALIQEVVQVLGPSFATSSFHRGLVVLTAAPEEQHTLGIHLFGEFLRRAGWGVHLDPQLSREGLIEIVETKHVDMVGISVSNVDLVPPVRRLVASLKRATVNRGMIVMIGGALDLADAALEMGAKYCSDPNDAVRWLERNVTFRENERPS